MRSLPQSPLCCAPGRMDAGLLADSIIPTRQVVGRRGITLVEMLVALVVTLIMMGAVITVFGYIGERVSDSRALIETNDRVRSAVQRLREDLAGRTVDMLPWQRPESGSGYFEILEGKTVVDPLNYPPVTIARNLIGDVDDVLMFTARSRSAPFVGKVLVGTSYQPIDSQLAEVAWYLRPSPLPTNPTTFILCRRMRVIAPGLNFPDNRRGGFSGPPVFQNGAARQTGVNGYFPDQNDVSVRQEGQGGAARFIANSLGDLTKRENRMFHLPSNINNSSQDINFPFRVLVGPIDALPQINASQPSTWPLRTPLAVSAGASANAETREGDEIVLTNVLEWDIKVFDPTMPVKADNLSSPQAYLTPGDAGYRVAPAPQANGPVPLGTYVDLGNDLFPNLTQFGSMTQVAVQKSGLLPVPPSGNNPGYPYATYDTWSFHYEHDGVRQTSFGVDLGTDGLDNPNSAPGVDDVGERETSPPYPYPLRGIRIKMRVYEPSSKQVREVTIVESFTKE